MCYTFVSVGMGKTRANIQREYRQRKKETEGLQYAQKERNRVKQYYKPILARTADDAAKRRKQVNGWVKKHREHVRAASERISKEDNNIEDDARLHISNPLIVKIPFPSAKERTRKRVTRANAKHRRHIAQLQEENTTMKKKYKAAVKRCERAREHIEKITL
jgi:hypothetical protein